MRPHRTQPGGWILMEVAISVVLLAVLLATTLSIEMTAGRVNHFQLTKQRCIAAAQGALDSFAATGEPLSREDTERLWPGLSVAARRSPGTGDWAGLTLVTAVARGRSGGKGVTVELRRYILPVAGGRR